jgi:hypothetical protein
MPGVEGIEAIISEPFEIGCMAGVHLLFESVCSASVYADHEDLSLMSAVAGHDSDTEHQQERRECEFVFHFYCFIGDYIFTIHI